MTVLNDTRSTCLAGHAEIAGTPGARLRGLIGKPESWAQAGAGLWIMPCSAIHTFGMAFPIDVLFLDQANRVLQIATLFPDDRSEYPGAASVLELPPGMIAATYTQIGDQLRMVGAA